MALPRYFRRWGNYGEQPPITDSVRDITPSQWDTYTPMIAEELQSSLDALVDNDFILFSACSGDYPLEVRQYNEQQTSALVSGESFRASKYNPSIATRNVSGDVAYAGLAPLFDGTRRSYLGVDKNGIRWMNTDPAQVFITSGLGEKQGSTDFLPSQDETDNTPSAARWLKNPIYIPCDSGFDGSCRGDHVDTGYLKFTLDGEGYIADVNYPDTPSFIVPTDPETDPDGCILDVYLNDYLIGSTMFGCQTWSGNTEGSALNMTANGSLECSFVVPASEVTSGYLSFHKRNEQSQDSKPLFMDRLYVRVEHYNTTT